MMLRAAQLLSAAALWCLIFVVIVESWLAYPSVERGCAYLGAAVAATSATTLIIGLILSRD